MFGLATILPFPPTPFKGSPFTSALHLSLSRIIFSSTCPPLYRSHRLISISFISLPLFFSRILSYTLILSHSLLLSLFSLPPSPSYVSSPSLTLSLFPRSSSPSVSACSNMATRCPITRSVPATVFPLLYIRQRPRRRKDPHQPSRDTPFYFPFYFPLFPPWPLIHPYSPAAYLASPALMMPSCLLSHAQQQPIRSTRFQYKLGNRNVRNRPGTSVGGK